MHKPLTGRVALVTGASSGIGEATALALAAADARVAVSGRRGDRLEALVEKIKAAGGDGIALAGDVTDEEVARNTVRQTVSRLGRIDILVNSAGSIQPGGIENANIKHWRGLMELNFFATLYTCTEAVTHMRQQGSGDIINISSTAGRVARAPMSAYTSSKFALAGMSETLRQEVAPHGIRVCVIQPGATSTEISEQIEEESMRDFMRQHINREGAMQAQDIADAIMLAVTLPRRANIAEMLILPTSDTRPM